MLQIIINFQQTKTQAPGRLSDVVFTGREVDISPGLVYILSVAITCRYPESRPGINPDGGQMKVSFGIFLMSIQIICIGCAQPMKQPPPKSEEIWKKEIKEITHTGQTYHPVETPDEGVMFFNKNKPQLKTVQLWLESGKTLTETIKTYIKSIMPGEPDPDPSLIKRISGQWYGLDPCHESAIVFTFAPDGHFSWETGKTLKKGTYTLVPSPAPPSITLNSPALPGEYSRQFEFITDKALLFKGGDRDLILFKKG